MSEYLVEMKQINKAFSGVKALEDVDFNLKPGEVMALLGENGAGKSTLMKILSGVINRDSGSVKVFGKEVGDLDTKEAQKLGISIIHQELNMCPDLTIAENIFLGNEIVNRGLIDRNAMNQKTREFLERLGLEIDPEILVGDLSVSVQQLVEIAKALSFDAKVVIMDEPTSALTSAEIERLFNIIQDMKDNGCGVVYISHRLEELAHITDRVTILRDGKFVIEGEFSDFTLDRIITNMVGREITEQFPRDPGVRQEKIFSVKNLSNGKRVKDVSFDLYAGEVLGIAGLMGAGRTETTRCIFGVEHLDSGEIYLEGKKISINGPSDAIAEGIVLIPEDRKKDGLATELSINDNLALPNLDLVSNKLGVINQNKEKNLVDSAIKNFNVKLASKGDNASSLSGGNQQKIVIGKWLSRESKVIIFDEPTRGIDVGSKVEIYNLINDLKKQGVGVLVVSSEMPEVMGISDRIIVMCDGKVTGEYMHDEATEDKIMADATAFEIKK